MRAPHGFGSERLLSPSRSRYEKIGCGGLQRPECTQVIVPVEIEGNGLGVSVSGIGVHAPIDLSKQRLRRALSLTLRSVHPAL
jgi:hypothetical protein